MTTDQRGYLRTNTPSLGAFDPINQFSTTTTVSNATTTFNTNDQYVMLTANVASSGAGVTEGMVTFTVKQGSTIIGTATSTSTFDNSGNASVRYLLPAGKAPAGSYTIEADYSDSSGKFAPSSGQATLTINKATPAASVMDAGGPYTGSPFPAAGTAVGTNGQTVSGSFSYVYYVVTGTSGTSLGSTAPSNAGTYTVGGHFHQQRPQLHQQHRPDHLHHQPGQAIGQRR